MKKSIIKLLSLALLLFGFVSGSYAATIYTTINDGRALGTVDTITGTKTTIGDFGYNATYGNAFDTDGTLYVTANSNKLATVNLTTGAATIVGNLLTYTYAIEVDSLGNLYGLGTNGLLYSIDKNTGAGTSIGNTGIGSMMDIAFDSNDNLWGVVNGRLYNINTANGSIISSVLTNLGGANMGIMFDENDTLWASLYTSNSGLYTLNTSTGVGTLVHNSGIYYPHGGDIYNPVPDESASIFLFSIGLLSLTACSGIIKNKRRQTK